MRLGGPIFKKVRSVEEAVAEHKRLGFGASYVKYVDDNAEREEYKRAFGEADIVLAEFGAYCINILDTDPKLRQKNIDEICRRLEKADAMGARCCVIHGGSVETGGWGKANPENVSERSFIETVNIVRGIIDRVRPATAKLVMETESYLFPDGPEEYLRIIDAVGRKEFAVHFDPVNIIASPRRYYFNGQFIRKCLALLGEHVVSCHAKDLNMAPIYPTVRIDETYIGDGVLDYNAYLRAIAKLDPAPTLMIEHLNESQLVKGLKFIYRKAEENGIVFEGSQGRGEISEENAGTEYFAPHK
jgi:sugar phosphate isomerase/epimerase